MKNRLIAIGTILLLGTVSLLLLSYTLPSLAQSSAPIAQGQEECPSPNQQGFFNHNYLPGIWMGEGTVPEATPTATQTPTTTTPLCTPTPSGTPTNSPIGTPSATITATNIPVSTATNTPASTATNTPTATNVPPTNTPTSTPISVPNGPDLFIDDVELIQASQRADSGVPLVQDKTTLLRVYAEVSNGSAQSGVSLSVTARRNGAVLGTQTIGPKSVPTNSRRSVLDDSFNMELPSGWLSGNVELTISLDSENTVNEQNEGNNVEVTTAVFNNVPTLNVVIVPIDYTHNGSTNPGYYPGQAVDNISDWMLRAYPLTDINVTFRTPYSFNGNLQSSSDWSRLLNEVTSLKSSDGAPSETVYYAFVPTASSSSQWFFGGIAGIGWIGSRSSVGLDFGNNDNTGELAGHEIGHNFGRRHAPCGGPSGVDTSYPYSDAYIGQYGYDAKSDTLIGPEDARDFMSYCSPEWVSDYTYEALYQEQMNTLLRAETLSQTAVSSYQIAITTNENGSYQFAPVYATTAVPSAGSAEPTSFTIEFVDASGNVLESYAVAPLFAEEKEVATSSIFATLPQPAQPASAVRLVENGVVLAEQPLSTLPALRGAASLTQSSRSLTLRWPALEQPARIRFTADDGDTWTTLTLANSSGKFIIDKALLGADNGRFEITIANTAETTTYTLPYN